MSATKDSSVLLSTAAIVVEVASLVLFTVSPTVTD